jgi:hypothetical protein
MDEYRFHLANSSRWLGVVREALAGDENTGWRRFPLSHECAGEGKRN